MTPKRSASHIRTWPCLAALCCILLAPAALQAQGRTGRSGAARSGAATPKPTPKPEATPKAEATPKNDAEDKADSSKTEDKNSSTAQSGFGSFGDLPFKSIKMKRGSGDADGNLNLEGDVSVIGDALSIDCDVLKVNQSKKVMNASGGPCKIKMNGIDAVCREYTYDMDKKASLLEGSPRVVQKNGTKTTTVVGDVIHLTQDANGKITWSIDSKAGSTVPPSITTTDSAEDKPKSTGGAPKAAVKVTNSDIIHAPTIVN